MSYLWALAATVLAIVVVAAIRRMRTIVTVYPWQVALVYRDGAHHRTLEAGRHVLIDPRGRLTIATISVIEQQVAFGGMEVVSSDQFAFRIQLSLAWRPIDPRALYESAGDMRGIALQPPGLHDLVAEAAIAAVGARALDEIVTGPAAIGAIVTERLANTIPHVEIVRVLVTKLQFPPETRRMLTDAERARREGLAALERARAEQAALRALANAARLVRDNPELAQLRLLQSVEASKGPTTFIVGDTRAGGTPPAA